MKIYVCQTTPKVGDLENNFQTILDLYLKSCELGADICMFPELALPGYMVRDFFTYQNFVENVEEYNKKLVKLTKNTCLLLPTITRAGDKSLYNSTILAQNGQIIGVSNKTMLPAYGIFEEPRYFKSGKPLIFNVNSHKIGVPICADIWTPDVCQDLKNQGAQIFLVPNASPYEKNKFYARYSVLKDRYEETKIPLIYCNQVIGQDGIIFEGKSMCYDGELKVIGKSFKTSEKMVYFDGNNFTCDIQEETFVNEQKDILDATILGVRSYVNGNNFQKVILGLSGGIDSAIATYIAVCALGPENVMAYMLPSIYTSKESIEDAAKLADNLGIKLQTIKIDAICQQFTEALGASVQLGSITHQNLQSRARGTILMALANQNNALLITTGNKSEYACGYATIYGDMNGAFNPIKDLYKTEIYKLAEYINKENKIIPRNIITKEPTAELKPDQKDSDSLGSYEALDAILIDHIEHKKTLQELQDKYDSEFVSKVIKLVTNSEFKRRQSAPGVKLSNNSFDLERRVPITHNI